MIGLIVLADSEAGDFKNAIFYNIAGHPVIRYSLVSAINADMPHKVILAMPAEDRGLIYGHVFRDKLIDFSTINTETKNIETLFFGDRADVIGRIYQAGIKFGLTDIIIINGNSPTLPGWLIDRVVCSYFSSNNRYTITSGYSEGFKVEAVSFWQLAQAYIHSKDRNYKTYISERFSLNILNNEDEVYIKPIEKSLIFKNKEQAEYLLPILSDIQVGADIGDIAEELV